MNIGVLNS